MTWWICVLFVFAALTHKVTSEKAFLDSILGKQQIDLLKRLPGSLI